MYKNKIALKLSLNFAAALLIFAIVMSGIFMILFRSHTIDLHKTALENRAATVAQTLSEFMQRGGAGGGYGAYLRFIGDIAGTDVWIVDQDLNLITGGVGHGSNHRYQYKKDLPLNAEQIIDEVFTNTTVFSEDFSDVLAELTLTVGVPIQGQQDEVIGVVLLHSSVYGINEAVEQGAATLLISLALALVVALLLSIWLSKRFTDPITAKEAADALRLEKTRRDFVANVSHELRTPVTVIKGSLEALSEKVVTNPQKVETYYTQMLHEANHLERLVGDLLDLSRLQNMDFVIEKSEISMCEVVEDAIRSASQLAREKGVSIGFKHTVPQCRTIGDYGRLRQMLMIVLANAIKFSPENGVVDVAYSGKTICIKDYGPGIAEEEQPYIFDRFYKSRTEDNKTGTGLGLAIAKQIADRHGITLNVKSTAGQGAQFIFELNTKATAQSVFPSK